MLNILLSALLDPDRRLRSFRRSERLASILVCSISTVGLAVVQRFFLVWHPTEPGLCCVVPAAALALPFSPDLYLVVLEVTTHPLSLCSWYFSFAGLRLVGINPHPDHLR